MEAEAVKVVGNKNRYGDPWIWGIYCTLCIISIIEAFSSSVQQVGTEGLYGPVISHVKTMLVGVAALFFVQFLFKTKWFLWYIVLLAITTLVLLVYVMNHGEMLNYAMRSLRIFGFSVQPAELAKLSTVMLVALIMSRYQELGGVRTVGVVLSAVVVLLYGGLTYKQGFTNTAILMSISLSMMLIGGVQMKKFFIVLLVYGVVAAGYLAWDKYSTEKEQMEAAAQTAVVAENASGKVIDRNVTRANRIARFDWNEDSCLQHPLIDEYHQEQYAYMARAHGGLFGVFPGNSRESSRLPLAFSDYIYSIIVEETGFVGGLIVLMLYLALLARAGNIAQRCTKAFPALLVLGMAVMITIQALSHIAINCGMVPVSGQPLPLISAGGSSIAVINMAFGVMIGVSRYATQRDENGKMVKAVGSGDGTKLLQAENPTQVD